jgi:hypothetical protein
MQEKAADELLGEQSHAFLFVSGLMVFPAEGDFAVLQTDEPVVSNGNAGIGAEIVQDLLRAAEWWFGIDHPFDPAANLIQSAKASLLDSLWSER